MKKDYSTLKTDYFHDIDTKEKAYWLGFLFADGYVNKAGTSMSLNLADKDEEQIDKFLKVVGLERCDFKRYYGPYKNTGKFVQIAIANREFVSGLIKNGCTNKKTLTTVLPDFKDEGLDLAFLLGYYDGDGTAKDSELTCGNLSFLQSIKEKYSLKFNIRVKSDGAYNLTLGDTLKKAMLNSYENSMGRKRIKYPRKSKSVKKFSLRKERITKIVVATEKQRKTGICSNCKDEFIQYRKSLKFCSQECSKTSTYKFNISKEELEVLIGQNSYIALGKKFGVSGNAIKKRVKKLGILL